MKKICMLLILIMSTVFIMPTVPAHAGDVREIEWGTEVWKGFTDKDGTGLYDRIFRTIFNEKGIEVKVSYMPFARTLHLVRIGKLDFAGGIPKDKEAAENYIQAKYPVVVSRFNVFFHKDAIKDWKGLESINGRKIVSTPTVAEMIGLKNNDVYEVTERKQALQMVLTKRAEFYVDDEKVLENTMRENIELFDSKDYRVENVTTSGWFMIAPKNERGKTVLDIYENGTKELAESGRLAQIYTELGFSVPDLSIYE